MDYKYFKKQFTIPNLLSFVRLIAIPLMVYLILQKTQMNLALFCFIMIWLTDVADGYIARHFNQISDFGKVFDPFVDKMFQLSAAISMYYINRLPVWVLCFIFVKEILMVAGGFFLWKNKTVVSSRWYGKLTTFLYVAAFIFLFYLDESHIKLIDYIFAVPTVFAVISFIKYTLLYSDQLKECEEMQKSKIRHKKEDINKSAIKIVNKRRLKSK